MNNRALIIWLALLAFHVFVDPVFAEIFQYTDSDGTLVFVDDADKVPCQFRKQARLREMPELPKTFQHSSTRVTVTDNKVYVPVTVSYHGNTVNTWFLLDTGASITIISAQLAEKLGIQTTDTIPGSLRVADGRIVPSLTTKVNFLSVKPKTIYDLDVGILRTSGPQLPYDGWLGMNFLGEFRHQLDASGQTIQWIE